MTQENHIKTSWFKGREEKRWVDLSEVMLSLCKREIFTARMKEVDGEKLKFLLRGENYAVDVATETSSKKFVLQREKKVFVVKVLQQFSFSCKKQGFSKIHFPPRASTFKLSSLYSSQTL